MSAPTNQTDGLLTSTHPQHASLIDNKYAFLTSESSKDPLLVTENLKFLIDNRIELQQEYDNLERVYKRSGLSPAMADWFIHVCAMLETCHSKNKSKARDYRKQRLVIQGVTSKVKDLDLESKQIKEQVSLDNARKTLGGANMWRLSTRFAMITAGATAAIVSQYSRLVHWIEIVGRQPMDSSILLTPVSAYNILSVGLFSMRALVNVIDIVQSMWNASEDEKKLYSFTERLFIELDKHEYQFGNDLTWIIVNFFTNFPQFLRQFAPFANHIVGAFLVFDVLLMLRTFYKDNKQVLNNQKSNLDLLSRLGDMEGIDENILTDIRKQLVDSNYQQEKLQWQYACFFAAGILLLVGFSAAIIFSPPMFVPLCFLACNIGIAMYMSGEKAGLMMEKRMIYQQEPGKKAKKEADDASQAFLISMLENTFVPLAIITVFMINPFYAIGLTALYLFVKSGLASQVTSKITEEIKEIPKQLNKASASVSKFFSNGYERLESDDKYDDDVIEMTLSPFHRKMD